MPDAFTNPESIERGKSAAGLALSAFVAQPGHDTEDDETNIVDLIANLAHLADEIVGPGAGYHALDSAFGHFTAEQDYQRPGTGDGDGTSGQDRESYTDDQDRESYSVDDD
jgi:hypothetical protein